MCSNSFRVELHLSISSNVDTYDIKSHLPVHKGDLIRVQFSKEKATILLECVPMIAELSYFPRIIRKIIIGRGKSQHRGELTYL